MPSAWAAWWSALKQLRHGLVTARVDRPASRETDTQSLRGGHARAKQVLDNDGHGPTQ